MEEEDLGSALTIVAAGQEVGLAGSSSWHGVLQAEEVPGTILGVGGGGGWSTPFPLQILPWQPPIPEIHAIVGLAVGIVTLVLALLGFRAQPGRPAAAVGTAIIIAQLVLFILVGSPFYFGIIVGILGGALLIAGSRGAGKRPATEAAS